MVLLFVQINSDVKRDLVSDLLVKRGRFLSGK